jgi:hypothetical protein
MKNKMLLPALVGALLTAMVLSGCATAKIIAIDKTIAKDATAVVYPYSQKLGMVDGVTLTLKSLDGGPLPKGYGKSHALRVPAGEHTFIADGRWYSGLTVNRAEDDGGPYRLYFSAKKAEFTYDFKPGVSYYLELVLGGGKGASVTLPLISTSLSKPRRTGGEPFIGQLAIYSVEKYDKKAFPVVTEADILETIGFTTEVSF